MKRSTILRTVTSFFVFLFLLLSVQAFSQQLNYRKYSIDEGLPQSEVLDVIEDQRGILWVGTNNGGLCRFNGKEFEVFTEKDGLSDNAVQMILESRKGDLWLFGYKGITKYDGLHFSQIKHNENYVEGQVVIAFEDATHDDEFWLMVWRASGSSLLHLQDSTITEVNWRLTEKVKDAKLWHFSQNVDGSLLITTQFGSYDFDLEKQSLKKSYLYLQSGFDDDRPIARVHTDKQKRSWYKLSDQGNPFEFYKEDRDVFTKIDLPLMIYQHGIKGFSSDSRGNLWIKTMGYLIRYDGNEFRYYGKNIGISGESISKVIEDNEGNIWIGTLGGGLIRYTDDSFMNITKEDGLPSEFVRAVFQDSQENIWFGLTAGSVAKFDGSQVTPYHFPGACNVEVVTSIFEDPKGKLTFATNQGFYHFIDGKLTNVNQLYNIPFGTTIGNVEVEADTIWVHSYKYGLMKFVDGEYQNWSPKNSKFPSYQVYGFDILKNGNIWVNYDGGASVFNRKEFKPIVNFGTANKPTLLQVAQDKKGTIWAATFGDGLIRFKGDSVDVFTMDNSDLPTNIIYSILFDGKESIWLGTQVGITEVKLGMFGEIKSFRNYDRYDGFKGQETNGSAVMQDKNGGLWFGTIKGAVRFAPDLRRKNNTPPALHIKGVDLFYERINWTEKCYQEACKLVTPWYNLPVDLELKHRENHLTFHFEGLNHAAPEKVSYKWKLENFDNDWSPVTDEQKAVYTHLSPGKYTFQVMAANSDGVWTKEPVTYNFEIRPAFWQTTWFIVLIVFFSVILILIFLRLREKALIEEKNRLERKVRERTAEITQQKEEIETQRDEIEAQRDEIEAQRDEIEAQRDEILAQRDFVTRHRDELEKANNNITDSIRYAKRIQQAVVPPVEVLKNSVPESFVFFRPRDIVSGDFYWFKQIDDMLVVAAADCTGHGVPGAFMSMLGVSMINELIRQREISTPSELLEEMRKYTKQSLRQTGRLREPHDGMDIAALAINMQTKVLQYAGAHNPLYIVRKTQATTDEQLGTFSSAFGEAKLFEVKPTPNPIGMHVKEEPFKNHKIQLQEGDTVYIFSDGYVDQFGGNQGYKYMAKRFKRLLVESYELPMDQQWDKLVKTMDKWRHGDEFEQVDDMLVIGLRF